MSKSKRVLIVSPGAQVEITHIARSLHEAGIPFLLFSASLISSKSNIFKFVRLLTKQTKFQDRLMKRIVEVENSESKSPFLIFEFMRTFLPNSIQHHSLLLRNFIFDIYLALWISLNYKKISLVIFQHHSAGVAIWIARKRKIHTVLNVSIAHHDWIEAENRFEISNNPYWSQFLQFRKFSKYEKWVLERECRYASYYLVASSFTHSTLRKISKHTPIKIIPLGTSRLPVNRTQTRPVENREFKIVVVGQLTQRKGISYILDAFYAAELPPSSKLIFAGRDACRMKKTLLEFPNVELLGHLSVQDLNLLFNETDLFICNSLIEGFSLTTLDAMASGLPVIASNRTFAVDIINHGNNGFIVDPRDITSIALIFKLACINPIYLAQISQAAALTGSQYTWEIYRKKISNYILEVLEKAIN